MKSWIVKTVIVVAVLATLVAGALAFAWYQVYKTYVQMNLMYTEEIDYLLKVVVYRLERGDDRQQLLTDLKGMSVNYDTRYEGQPFYELMQHFMERNIVRPPVPHAAFSSVGIGNLVTANEQNASFWTLRPSESAPDN